MSYSAILEKLDQTSIDMELKRTQFHDAKSALENAEENLNKLDKENIDYKSFRNDLNFYENFEKAKDAFKDENYEKSKEIAIQSSETSLNTIVEVDILISDKNKIREVLDDALIEKLQFDKKEKDDVKKSIKDIEKAIETGKLTDASQKIEDSIEKLETKITRKRILRFAPPSWNKLENLDKNTEIYEYYINDKWDLDGIKDDLKILNERKRKETADDGIKLDEVPSEWKRLEKIDKDANANDYRIKDRWDLDGIKADLRLMKKRTGFMGFGGDFDSGSKTQTTRKDYSYPWNIFEENDENKSKKQKIIPMKERVVDEYYDEKSQISETKKAKVKTFKKTNKGEKNVSGSKNKLEDLKDLKELYDEGLLDIDEFKQMKKEILGK